MDKREIAHRVNEARRLMDEPLLVEALDRIERDAIEEMIGIDRLVSAEDAAFRYRRAADRVATVREVRHRLQSLIAGGEAALRPSRAVA